MVRLLGVIQPRLEFKNHPAHALAVRGGGVFAHKRNDNRKGFSFFSLSLFPSSLGACLVCSLGFIFFIPCFSAYRLGKKRKNALATNS